MNRMIVTVKRSLLLMLLGVAALVPSACTHYTDIGTGDINQKLLLEKTLPTSAGAKLSVDVVAADVMVSTWNKNEVSVKIYGDDNALEKVDATVEKSGDGVLIEIEKKSFLKNLSNLGLRVEVITPENYSAGIKTSGGDVKVRDMKGSFALKTSGGDIGMKNLSGSLDAKTSGGNIRLEKFNGSANVKTSGGNVEVKDVEGSVDAGTSGGDMDIDSKSGAISASTSGGNIKLVYSGENQGIECSTSGGDIDVYVPADFKADVTLKTSAGSVSCELPASNVKSGNFSFTGTVNGGGQKLICKTSGGSISLNKLK